MAVLYISEYNQPGVAFGNTLATGNEPSVEQTVAISGTSAQSAVLRDDTVLVRIHTDAICSVRFGANPTATTSHKRLAASQTEYFSVPPKSGTKIAVISNT